MSEYTDAEIGQRVRDRRKADGLTMKGLAARLTGVHFTTIGKLETGKMKFTTEWVNALAEALRIPPAALTNSRFTPEAVRLVPLYDSRTGGWGKEPFQDVQALAEVPVLAEGARCYSVLVPDTTSPREFAFGHWFMTIDPDLRQMVDGGFYAIRFADHLELLAFASFHAETTSLANWPTGDREPVGDRAFQVIGRVVYQSRAISPAAGSHLEAFDQYLESYSEIS